MTTPPLIEETGHAHSGDYLCLFPERAQTPPYSLPGHMQYEQEVGVVNNSYEEEIDHSLMEQQVATFDPTNRTFQSESEFAELDPYLTSPQHAAVDFDPLPEADEPLDKATPPVALETEVGVDIGDRTVAMTTTPEGDGEKEQGAVTASPIESVLYSHSEY